jgi:hypothetical protein
MNITLYGVEESEELSNAIREQILAFPQFQRGNLEREDIVLLYSREVHTRYRDSVAIDPEFAPPMDGSSSFLQPRQIYEACVLGYRSYCLSQGKTPRLCKYIEHHGE